ncbi:MAG: flagellar biosynthesis anti-sigma factor FlgM [Sphingomonadales bacterium]|nr:MAG: flagellar biosynthesis anti-sigma factor FlgM [Sphingomonadales bacterium]
MPSVELSKLSGVSAPRAMTASDRAQTEARSRAATSTSGASPGVSVEIDGRAADAIPPVDAERVAQIRNALRNGSYPLVPARIADAMIAAQVSLSLPERS